MKHKMKKISKDSSGLLFKWIKLFYIPNAICLIAAFSLDCCKADYYKWAEKFFDYSEDIMISSLLVIWSLIAAILVYYLGRKDEKFYGLSSWEVISNGLCKWEKRIICIILFVELWLCLAAIPADYPITLVCIAVFLLISLAYSFHIVFRGTKPEIITYHLKELLKKSVHNVQKGAECRELDIVLRNIDFSVEEQQDFLLSILKECFYSDVSKNKCGRFCYRGEILWTFQGWDADSKKAEPEEPGTGGENPPTEEPGQDDGSLFLYGSCKNI